MVKLNENTNVSLPIRNLIALVAAVAIGVWAYFGIVERLNKLETSDTLFQADLLKKAEQEPKNLEMYMLIEHLAGQIESIEKEIEASRYNKVNIDHLKEQVDTINKHIEKLSLTHPNLSKLWKNYFTNKLSTLNKALHNFDNMLTHIDDYPDIENDILISSLFLI